MQKLLVDEMCRRKDLEDIVEAERCFSNSLMENHATRIRAFERTLGHTQNIQDSLEAQLADAQATSMHLEDTLEKCRADLEEMQKMLECERRERRRVTALLEQVRKERDSPLVVPAMAKAFSLIDGLTSQVIGNTF